VKVMNKNKTPRLRGICFGFAGATERDHDRTKWGHNPFISRPVRASYHITAAYFRLRRMLFI